MKLHFFGDVSSVFDGLDAIKNRLLIELCSDGEQVQVISGNGFLEISGTHGIYSIKYQKKAEFFRGLSILIDRIKKGEHDFIQTEFSRFDTCGTLVDVSSNGVLTLQTAKDFIERIALMGLNMLMLYTEDTYQIEQYPWFGYMRGAYTQDELRAIDAHCQKFGIECIPCIQTLGHLKTTLRWPYADEIRDTQSVLLVDEPKTYDFIEEMIRACRVCFTSHRIHIGLDEAFGLGEGRYKELHGSSNKYELMIRHIEKVSAIAKKYDFTPMMWSDMFFRLGKPQGDYDPEAILPSDAAQRLPKQLGLVYWDYCLESTDQTHKILQMHDVLEREVMFAGGIWTWNRMVVNMEKSFKTARCQLRACKQKGIRTVFVTIWGSGSANAYNIYATLPGLQMYAEQCYCDEVSDKHLERMFKICTGYDMHAFSKLYFDDFTDEEKETYSDGSFCVNPSFQHYHNDVLIGLLDQSLSGFDFKTRYQRIIENLCQLPNQGDMQWLFDSHRKLAEILLIKCDIGPRLTSAYRSGNRATMQAICDELESLNKKCEQFHLEYGNIWHRTYKPFGWETLDLDMAWVDERTKWAHHRVQMYLSDEINRIEELEADRFFFNGIERPLTEVASPRSFISAAYNMN